MKRYLPRVTILMLTIFFTVGIQITNLIPQSEQQIRGLNQLKQLDTTMQITWDHKESVPIRLQGKLSEPMQADPAQIAIAFFTRNQILFNMRNPAQEMEIIKTKTDRRGWKHVRLQQKYKSLPVEGKTYIVHINPEQEVRMATGNYLPQIDISTTPAIDSSAAINKARQNLNPQQDLSMTPHATLIVYQFKDHTYLAWKTVLVSKQPLGEFVYFINADNGDVINTYNNLQHALDRQTYDAQNGTSLPGTLRRSETDAPAGDQALDSAHDFAGSVYNFYFNQYNRDSFDGAGASIVSTVHYGDHYNNAFWSPVRQQMVYGDGDGTTFGPFSEALDIVAHELTHAVTEKESDLVYQNQSGALNESLSDIFAALIDDDDWMIGEDSYTPGTPGDALRYLDNPPLGNQPDHMDDYLVTTSDNGGVHTNSGIPNKTAYLMSEGGTHHGITVIGMGRPNMGRVFYAANLYYLQSYDEFADARQATIDAVRSEFPGDTGKENTVIAAWDAVGVGVFSLNLSPGAISMGQGDAASLTAQISDQGTPLAGATVSFSSADNSIATVSPTSAVTGADGRTTTTISGLSSCGSTDVTVTASHAGRTASSKVNVKVPVTSMLGLLITVILLMILLIRKNNQRSMDKKSA